MVLRSAVAIIPEDDPPRFLRRNTLRLPPYTPCGAMVFAYDASAYVMRGS